MADTRWLTPSELDDWRQFRRLMTLLPGRLARDLGDVGLSMPDYEVLSVLTEQPDGTWSLRDFAAKMDWSRSRLAHHGARMEARGLISRDRDPHDARGALYRITEAGRQALEAAAPAHVASVRARFIDHLSAEELGLLGELSRRIADLPER
ncbi:MarR family transcriptional regulator [Alteromonas gracilis]